MAIELMVSNAILTQAKVKGVGHILAIYLSSGLENDWLHGSVKGVLCQTTSQTLCPFASLAD